MSKTEEKATKQNQQNEEKMENIDQEKLDKDQVEKKVDEKQQLKEKNIELAKERLLLLAEIENIKKSFQKQRVEDYKYSNKKLILSILDFMINLEEMALKSMRNDPEKSVKNHLIGIEMMINNLWKKLEIEGVKEMQIKIGSDVWNSYLYELDEEVLDKDLPEGVVKEVTKKGYLLHDRVLRPAKVKITKKKV
jgi:molecular chaperone GrpE